MGRKIQSTNTKSLGSCFPADRKVDFSFVYYFSKLCYVCFQKGSYCLPFYETRTMECRTLFAFSPYLAMKHINMLQAFFSFKLLYSKTTQLDLEIIQKIILYLMQYLPEGGSTVKSCNSFFILFIDILSLFSLLWFFFKHSNVISLPGKITRKSNDNLSVTILVKKQVLRKVVGCK